MPKRKRAAKVDDADDSVVDTLPKKAKKMANGKKAQDKKEDTEQERAAKERKQKDNDRPSALPSVRSFVADSDLEPQ